MPDVKTIEQFYAEHEHAFTKHLKRAANLREKEIHKLRVEIKNLRVLFEFLQASTKKKLKLKKLLTLLDPIFKKAGKIRTAQLNLVLTRSYRGATMVRFREHLKKTEGKASKRFLKEIKKFDQGKLKNLHKHNLKALKKYATESVGPETESYVRSIFSKIRTTMFDVNKDEDLHQIRKYLKTIKNMGRLMKELNLEPQIHLEIKKVESIYEKIGKWHDGVAFTEAFENYIHKKEIPEVKEKALALVLNLKEKNEKTKLLLIKNIRAGFV